MKKHAKRSGHIYAASLELCLISPSAVVVSRELFSRYGLFDEAMPVCEDYDLWLRITSRETVGLINTPLIKKYGGHDDQLSRQEWGMDRFRIYAMLKMLNSAVLTGGYLDATYAAAIEKSRILRNGALKRERYDYAEKLDQLMSALNERSSNIDSSFLLTL